jgi:hypothetical protein
MAYFKVLFWHSPGETKENNNNFSQDSWSPRTEQSTLLYLRHFQLETRKTNSNLNILQLDVCELSNNTTELLLPLLML